jgi:superfamily II DNA or RNA helicase
MIRIVKGNVLSRVDHFDTDGEVLALKKALTFVVPNFWFTNSWKKRIWDGTYSFYNEYSQSFLTGLLSVLPPHVWASIMVLDGRTKPPVTVVPASANLLRGISLYDYQMAAIDDIILQERGIVQAATNGGKTEIGAGILKLLSPNKALWLTHRGDLLLQTKERLEDRLQEPIGVIHRDEFNVQRVTVGMVQTLYFRVFSKDKELRNFYRTWLSKEVQIIMPDECHHQSSSSWKSIVKLCNAYWRIGLSATPLMRAEIQNLWLIGLTGNEISTVRNRDLISRGISARPRILRIRNEIGSSAMRMRKYHKAYELGVELNEDRNGIIAGLVRLHKEKAEPCLVLVNTIRHGKSLMEIMPDEVRFLSGDEPTEVRVDVLHQLKEGKVPAVIATPIFDEGIDAPAIRVLILAGAGKSHIRLLQRIGRGMRRKLDGKNEVTIYDFEDRGERYLEGHSLYRLKLYHDEGFEVVPSDIKFRRE